MAIPKTPLIVDQVIERVKRQGGLYGGQSAWMNKDELPHPLTRENVRVVYTSSWVEGEPEEKKQICRRASDFDWDLCFYDGPSCETQEVTTVHREKGVFQGYRYELRSSQCYDVTIYVRVPHKSRKTYTFDEPVEYLDLRLYFCSRCIRLQPAIRELLPEHPLVKILNEPQPDKYKRFLLGCEKKKELLEVDLKLRKIYKKVKSGDAMTKKESEYAKSKLSRKYRKVSSS